jgi:hypothetical protein
VALGSEYLGEQYLGQDYPNFTLTQTVSATQTQLKIVR